MKLISFILFSLCLTSCATLSPSGNWSYSITNTPEGDKNGVMSVSKASNNFNATLAGNGLQLKFNKFVYDTKTKKANGNFDYQGMNFYLDATVAGKEMNGTIATDGYKFPFKALRTK